MRTVAGERQPDESRLLVEVASLVSQTRQLLEEKGYAPRLDVDIP
jgi:hypothetical protein